MPLLLRRSRQPRLVGFGLASVTFASVAGIDDAACRPAARRLAVRRAGGRPFVAGVVAGAAQRFAGSWLSKLRHMYILHSQCYDDGISKIERDN